jgi:hypothetical protein
VIEWSIASALVAAVLVLNGLTLAALGYRDV